MIHLAGEVEKFGDVLAEKRVTLLWFMNLNMVKPETFDHLHLVYHFEAPLKLNFLYHLIYLFHYSQTSIRQPLLVPLKSGCLGQVLIS